MCLLAEGKQTRGMERNDDKQALKKKTVKLCQRKNTEKKTIAQKTTKTQQNYTEYITKYNMNLLLFFKTDMKQVK